MRDGGGGKGESTSFFFVGSRERGKEHSSFLFFVERVTNEHVGCFEYVCVDYVGRSRGKQEGCWDFRGRKMGVCFKEAGVGKELEISQMCLFFFLFLF